MFALDDPDSSANDGYRGDDQGNNSAVGPESFVEMLFVSWRPS
jgi:hypothetical protein